VHSRSGRRCPAVAVNPSSRTTTVDDLPISLRSALAELGFASVYSHQLETRNQIRAGKDVIITTPTSRHAPRSWHQRCALKTMPT